MSSLKINQANGKTTLAGFLDENSDLKPLEQITGTAVLDFKDVTRVNSCGVREWVNLMAKMSAAEVRYEQCPMVVVKQLNAVPDFVGRAKIGSFFAPYFCEPCDEDDLKLLEAAAVANGQPPTVNCAKCSKPMEFDAVPNQYFSFLKRAK